MSTLIQLSWGGEARTTRGRQPLGIGPAHIASVKPNIQSTPGDVDRTLIQLVTGKSHWVRESFEEVMTLANGGVETLKPTKLIILTVGLAHAFEELQQRGLIPTTPEWLRLTDHIRDLQEYLANPNRHSY